MAAKQPSSRRLAQTWPYPRIARFEEELRRISTAWFNERDLAVNRRMPYILAQHADWPHNILLPEVAAYIHNEQATRASKAQGFPLHKYLHHGLSSQAMAFNLVGPLIVEEDLSPLQAAFTAQGIPWPQEAQASFEYEDRAVFNEDSGQPTSIDLLIRGRPDVQPLMIEIKLTEKEFGGCSVFAKGDCDGRNPVGDFSRCYLHHIGRRYWERLAEFGFLDGPLGQEHLCPLAVHYQFFREVLFALAHGGIFVLLVDERNSAFAMTGLQGERGLYPLLRGFVPEKHQAQVQRITVQQVVAQAVAADAPEWMQTYGHEFAHRYGL